MNYEQEIINLKNRIADLERIVFKNSPPENVPQANRDKTKYMFQGKVYAKNRLVLAIIKSYVLQYNPTYETLCEVFDKSLQGSLGVVELYEKALSVSDAKKRFFLNEEDKIFLSNATAVVCTQWGIFNIVKFIKRAQALGFTIETI